MAGSNKPTFTIGSGPMCARNHAICEGWQILATVNGDGYPAPKGWHPRTEALTAWIVEAMNEKLERDGRSWRKGVDHVESN